MAQIRDRKQRRHRIHLRIRKVVSGTAERPRLVVFRSLSNVYAQLIDDARGATLVAASTIDKDLRGTLKQFGNRAAGRAVGKAIADRARDKGITEVVFDRAGFHYHGVVKELADAAREAGLKF
ncbi:MAG: 50S ribosomal protein L18 [Acidobacteria bacterium RBG_13_68_16]|jgi:large subunit ribosomal protein L18|nr:MAG: 50S ribosomal protein L18 [Acidobacteria bacterium RBG_13_68_16]